jgi:hypothetical protein
LSFLVGVVTTCTFTIVINIFYLPTASCRPYLCKISTVILAVLPLILLLCFFHFVKPVTYLLNFRVHSKDITNVTFHRKYPLFASSSEDCTAYVCHGMVYSDLNQNPLIVPLEILRGHSSSDGRGMHAIGSIISIFSSRILFTCIYFFSSSLLRFRYCF